MTPNLPENLQRMCQTFWARQQPLRRPASPLSAKPTVLVVDDDTVLLELMQAVLISAGFNTLTANRGTKGLELLHQTAAKVKVLILDYQMPIINGAQMLPCVRRLAPATKVLGVSGTDPYDLPPGFRAGVDQLLRKPFTRNDLIGSVSALLRADRPAADCQSSRFFGLKPVYSQIALARQ